MHSSIELFAHSITPCWHTALLLEKCCHYLLTTLRGKGVTVVTVVKNTASNFAAINYKYSVCI